MRYEHKLKARWARHNQVRYSCKKCDGEWRLSVAEAAGNNNKNIKKWTTNSTWNLYCTTSCNISDKDYKFKELLK